MICCVRRATVRRGFCGQSQSFIVRIGVEALGSSNDGSQCLYGYASHVVEGLLAARETPATCVETQHGGFGVGCRRFDMRSCRVCSAKFATSSKKSLWQLKKNESLGAKSSMAMPVSMADSTYAKALASVKANSWTAVEPASRMW